MTILYVHAMKKTVSTDVKPRPDEYLDTLDHRGTGPR